MKNIKTHKFKNIFETVKYVGGIGLLSVLSGCGVSVQQSEKADTCLESVVQSGKEESSNKAYSYSINPGRIWVDDIPCTAESFGEKLVEEIKPVQPVEILENKLLPEIIPEDPLNDNPSEESSVLLKSSAQHSPSSPWSLLIFLGVFAALGSLAGFRSFSKQKPSKIEKLKKAYGFFVSMPELSRPGITESSVFEFIKEYSPNTPALLSKLAASYFMDALPDANQFSKLELMILANTVKNQYSPSDTELCKGICRIVENYDRAVMEFDELVESVVELNTVSGHEDIGSVSESICSSLVKLNAQSGRPSLSELKAEYRAQIVTAEHMLEKENYDGADKCFQYAISLNSRRSEAYFGLAGIYEKKEFFGDAIGILNKLITSKPCAPVRSRAYLLRARMYASLGNYELALSDLSEASNGDLYKYTLKNFCLSQSGRVKSVKERIIDASKKGLYCYAKPAFSYWQSTKKKKRENISDSYNSLIDAAKRCASKKFIDRAAAFSSAEDCYSRAINLDCSRPAAYLGLCELYSSFNGKDDKILGIAESALKNCDMSRYERKKFLKYEIDQNGLFAFSRNKLDTLKQFRGPLFFGWLADCFCGLRKYRNEILYKCGRDEIQSLKARIRALKL